MLPQTTVGMKKAIFSVTGSFLNVYNQDPNSREAANKGNRIYQEKVTMSSILIDRCERGHKRECSVKSSSRSTWSGLSSAQIRIERLHILYVGKRWDTNIEPTMQRLKGMNEAQEKRTDMSIGNAGKSEIIISRTNSEPRSHLCTVETTSDNKRRSVDKCINTSVIEPRKKVKVEGTVIL